MLLPLHIHITTFDAGAKHAARLGLGLEGFGGGTRRITSFWYILLLDGGGMVGGSRVHNTVGKTLQHRHEFDMPTDRQHCIRIEFTAFLALAKRILVRVTVFPSVAAWGLIVADQMAPPPFCTAIYHEDIFRKNHK